MKQILAKEKQKFVIASVVAIAVLLSLESASSAIATYQLKNFFQIAIYGYVFLVFIQSFVSDLHLKRALWQSLKYRFEYMLSPTHFAHYLNYLILPAVIYWSTVFTLFLNPFTQQIKQLVIFFSTAALATSFWYMKTVFYKHHEAKRAIRQSLFVIKSYASYLSFLSAFGLARYFGVLVFRSINLSVSGQEFFVFCVFMATFLLFYQALFQHHYMNAEVLGILISSAIVLSGLGFVLYEFWNVNYFSGALLLSAVYNTIWSFVHHGLIDKNLSRKMIYEYLAVLFVIVVIVLSTTNFAERV